MDEWKVYNNMITWAIISIPLPSCDNYSVALLHCQVTQWLRDMLTQQLLPGHGDIGEGVTAVERLSAGHGKFSDNALKHYK